ncbi:hypothetical protein [Hydrocarboniphaga sp.]|uniref:hypothetical protein n=1 Tax=Hydrocarboniphaga sp. TaxID=2033016 RepID=UPI003D132E99
MSKFRIASSNPEPEDAPVSSAAVAAIQLSARARLDAIKRAIEARRLQKRARSR